MKRFLLLLFAIILIEPVNAEAASCKDRYYWNSLKGECRDCSSCLTYQEVIVEGQDRGKTKYSICSCLSCPSYAKLKEYIFDGTSYCFYCDAGTFLESYKGQDVCAGCPAGTYTNYKNIQTSCTPCPPGTWSGGRASSCNACSSIKISNGTCTACSADGVACTGVSCNSGYTLSNGQCVKKTTCNSGYVERDRACVKAATCTYPLKEVTDYSGECAGCCTD